MSQKRYEIQIILVSPAMGHWGTSPWSLRIHANLAIFSFPVYYFFCINICDSMNMQAVPLLAQNPGDATDTDITGSAVALHCVKAQCGNSHKRTRGVRLPPLPLPLPSPTPFSPLPSLPSRREVAPLNPAKGSGERCKLPHWGPGQSPGHKRIFGIF